MAKCKNRVLLVYNDGKYAYYILSHIRTYPIKELYYTYLHSKFYFIFPSQQTRKFCKLNYLLQCCTLNRVCISFLPIDERSSSSSSFQALDNGVVEITIGRNNNNNNNNNKSLLVHCFKKRISILKRVAQYSRHIQWFKCIEFVFCNGCISRVNFFVMLTPKPNFMWISRSY